MYQFYFQEFDSMMEIVAGEPWNIEDHLLILQLWQEPFQLISDDFYLVEFWVQIWGLPHEWYFERIGISQELRARQ